jgi:hypothetical protein
LERVFLFVPNLTWNLLVQFCGLTWNTKQTGFFEGSSSTIRPKSYVELAV